MNCAEIRRLPWLIRLLTSALLAALVLTPAPLALSASRTRPLSMLLLVLTAVLAKVLAPLVQSSRNNHSVPNPLCSVCCAGDFLMQKFLRQHRIIPALRLKHRSDGCGTTSALPKCSIMSGCGTRIVLRGQKPLALCDRCPCFGSLFPPLAALTFAASSIICAFGLAAAAPRSPYRYLELCGIAFVFRYTLGKQCQNHTARNHGRDLTGYIHPNGVHQQKVLVVFLQAHLVHHTG